MNSRFFILELLKENPGCQVFLGADSLTRKKVIIKQVKPQAHQVWFEQFRMEIKVLSALDHDRIPKIVEFRDDPLESWLAEEFIEGQNLEKWMKSHPGRSEKIRVFLEILELIGQVHQAGYLYLDLKPDNILIQNGHACLIDFNSALPIGSVRPILVNRASLPPEGLEGKAMDERADQIGLGRIFLQLFGPSAIAWTALAKKPEARFRSLEVFSRQVRKTSRQRPLCFFGAITAGIAAACIGFLVFGPMHAPVPSNATHEQIQAVDAAALCQSLQEKPRELGQGEWLQAAQAAFIQNHLPLAGYLYEHVPPGDGFQTGFYEFLLATILNCDLPMEKLEWLLEKLPGQFGWIEQLEQLCIALQSRQLVLEADQLQQLFDQAATQVPMEEKCCQALMNYLLFCLSKRQIQIDLASPLQDQFEKQTPDLFALYTGSTT